MTLLEDLFGAHGKTVLVTGGSSGIGRMIASAFVGAGARVMIAPMAQMFLFGTEIDYETTRLSSKFVFNNPNQTDACGCGESVTIVPVAAD